MRTEKDVEAYLTKMNRRYSPLDKHGTYVLRANINDLISKSEDPEKMLNQVIVDMNTQLVEAKKQVAVAIADEKRLQKQLQGETTVAEEWQRKAMLAIRAGDDELAKEALLRKKEHDQLAATFQDQWQKQKNATDQLKLALRALNNKIEEAKRKKNVLIAQKRRAEAMKSIQDTMSGLSQTSAFDTFDRMAEKINQMEAEAEAGAELSEEYSGDVLKHKFSKLEATSGADGDLEALKRQMGLRGEARRSRPSRSADEREAHGVPSGDASAEEALLRAELEAALAVAVEELDGPSAEAIHAALGRVDRPAVPDATFRKRLSRAYERLRAAFRGGELEH
jgi:phage shock protein A